MIDTSMIALDDLIEIEAGIRLGKRTGNGEKAARKGPCPWCQGTDRFAVFVNAMPNRYYCGIHGNGCGQRGDAITFLVEYQGVSFHEACEKLGVHPGTEYSRPRYNNATHEDEVPSEEWQQKVKDFCVASKDYLWNDIGKNALAWLKARGFTEGTLKTAGIGYNPETEHPLKEDWGIVVNEGDSKGLWLPRGITIPWKIDGQLWKVSIRRPNPDIARQKQKWLQENRQGEPPKYVEIVGGSQGLYGVDEIRSNEPLVLVEGVFDKLIFQQAIGYRVPCVATGSTGQGRGQRWIQEIKKASSVLVAYDYDEKSKAGDKAALFWKSQLDTFARFTPWAKDINEMHLAGIDLNTWLDTGLEIAELPYLDGLENTTMEVIPELPSIAIPEKYGGVAALRSEIARLVREEETRWMYSDKLDPRWPLSAKVYRRLERIAE